MLSSDFLYGVLACLLKDPDFAERYLPLIPDYLFDDYPILNRAWLVLKDYHAKYHDVPELLRFGGMMMDGWSSTDRRNPLPKEEEESVIQFISTVELDNLQDKQWRVDEITREVQRIRYRDALREGATVVNSEEFNADALADQREKIHDLEAISFETNRGATLWDNYEARIARRASPRTRVPTWLYGGTWDLDLDGLGGGVPMKSLACVAARTNVGKSIALVHFAKVASLNGFPVLFITLELSQEWVEDRFDASFTGTVMDDLVKEEEFVRKQYEDWFTITKAALQEGCDTSIRIVEEVPGSFSIEKLTWLLDQLKREHFEPKVVVIDYADLMKMPKDYNEKWQKLGLLYIQLRGIAVERNILVWTASQLNREMEIAGADEKIQNSDLVLYITQDEEDRVNNRSNIVVKKSRFGAKNSFVISQDFASMNFTTNSPTFDRPIK